MKIMIKESGFDRYKFLLEYQVKSGELHDDSPEPDNVFDSLASLIGDDESESDKDDEFIDPAHVGKKQEIENTSDTDVNISDNTTFEDNAADLLKIHAAKIEKLMKYIDSTVSLIGDLTAKSELVNAAIDDINSKLTTLNTQVEVLTPPTPLEALDKMVDITTGAQRIEDYWDEYYRKNGKGGVESSIYYNNKGFNQGQKGMNNGVYKTPQINELQIKEIIKNS